MMRFHFCCGMGPVKCIEEDDATQFLVSRTPLLQQCCSVNMQLRTFLRDEFLVKFSDLRLKIPGNFCEFPGRSLFHLTSSILLRDAKLGIPRYPSQGGQFRSRIMFGCIVVACWRSRRLHLLSSQFSMHACCGWRQREGLYEPWNDFISILVDIIAFPLICCNVLGLFGVSKVQYRKLNFPTGSHLIFLLVFKKMSKGRLRHSTAFRTAAQ